MKKIRILASICVLAILFTGCGAGTAKDEMSDSTANGGASYDKGYDYDMPAADVAPSVPSEVSPDYADKSDSISNSSGSDLSTETVDTTRKLIKNGRFTLETLDFDKTVADIEALIAQAGGYVQNSNVSGIGAITYDYVQLRRANFTVRIPAGGFTSFEAGLTACGSVLSRNVYVDEVTDRYYDTEARLSSLQLQEKQLLELMEKADKLEYIITLQQELSNIRYQIESLQGTLRRLDDQIAFSTIHITVEEVYEHTVVKAPPKTLGQRISYTFNKTWDGIVEDAEDFTVYFLGNIIILAFWAIIIAVVIIIIIKRSKRKKAQKAQYARMSSPSPKDESEDEIQK